MKINNLSFIFLGLILLGFAFCSATDTSYSSLKGIEHQETLKKIKSFPVKVENLGSETLERTTIV